MGAYLSEKNAIVGALAPIAAGSTVTMNSTPVNMKDYRRLNILYYFGAKSSTAVVTVQCGTDTSLGTAINFRYQVAGSATTAASVLTGAMTSVGAATGITLAATADSYKIYCIEVLDTDCGTAGPYVGALCGSASGTANVVAIVNILSDARYPKAVPASSLLIA